MVRLRITTQYYDPYGNKEEYDDSGSPTCRGRYKPRLPMPYRPLTRCKLTTING